MTTTCISLVFSGILTGYIIFDSGSKLLSSRANTQTHHSDLSDIKIRILVLEKKCSMQAIYQHCPTIFSKREVRVLMYCKKQ